VRKSPQKNFKKEVGGMAEIVNFDKMNIGKKGGGKHWTKNEVEQRKAAAQKVTRKKKVNLKMPNWLDEDARKVWKKTVKDMKGFDILDKVDEDVLATYCDAVSRYKETSGYIQERGYTVTNAQGVPTVSPYVKAQQSYARIMMQYADKLGLNANARARLAKKMADEEEDPNADLFD
jgi:P27 family predicted phage terminase small subunit